jgi:hypothetical protein
VASVRRLPPRRERGHPHAVADAADLAERGGRDSGIHIGERRFHLEG